METNKKRRNPYLIPAIVLIVLQILLFIWDNTLGWFVLICVMPFPVILLIVINRRSVHFLAQLSSLLNAGYQLPEALSLLKNYQPKYARRIDLTITDLENGFGFAEACRRRLRSLPGLVHRLIAEGEKQGELPQYLRVYLDYYETRASYLSYYTGALIYVTGVLAACVVLTFVLLIFVVPVFTSMFTDFGMALPEMTVITIQASEVFTDYIIWILLIAVLVYIIHTLVRGRGFFYRARRKLDTLLMLVLTGFSLKNGSELGTALAGAASIPKYPGYGRDVEKIESRLQNGAGWTEALTGAAYLPPDLAAALASGADAGDLPETLDMFTLAYREQYRLQTMISSGRLIVGAILFYGVVFGFITISMYLAIFKMGTIF